MQKLEDCVIGQHMHKYAATKARNRM